jgi:hypothetical protein
MLILFAQYYVPKNVERKMEIDKCFKKNIESSRVDKFIIYFEKEEDKILIPDNRKIEKKLRKERLTYGFWLSETNKYKTGTLSIIINSDIYITDTFDHLKENSDYLLRNKKFVALTRYNPEGNGYKLNEDPHWTQDCWAIVKTDNEFSSALIQEASFELGQPGCDNKIVAVMQSYNFKITNPCETVISIHLQADNKRDYDSKSNKLIGLHAFAYPTSSVFKDSKLDFDLLTRNNEPYKKIRINNWINDKQSYELEINKNDMAKVEFDYSEKDFDYQANFQIKKLEERNESEKKYKIILQKNFNRDSYKNLKELNGRFIIYEDEKTIYFYDKYWPEIKNIDKKEINFDYKLSENLLQLFAIGYIPHILKLETYEIGFEKRHELDYNFWQKPTKTEYEAYLSHNNLGDIQIKDGIINTYLAFPWATYIEQTKFNSKFIKPQLGIAYLSIISSRLKGIRQYISKFGYKLRVHTVCQQIYWKEFRSVFEKTGITDLWLSHKTKQDIQIGSMRIHSWPLYAVNIEEENRSEGIVIKETKLKKYLASFIGAEMQHYQSNIRSEINRLFSNKVNYKIELTNKWHFDDEVINQREGASEVKYEKSKQIKNYNETLSDSIFSLCPVGAGPNTIRLWESFAIGIIPVIIGDDYDFPKLITKDGKEIKIEDAIIKISEKNLSELDYILNSITSEEIEKRKNKCIEIYSEIINLTCFGCTSNKYSVAYEKIKKNKLIKILVPYYGEKDRYYWRQKTHGFFDLVMDWKANGWCEVEYHDGPHYWINKIGDILIFDRDQVADLYDKKRFQPRWEMEVPYKYAYFVNEYGLINDRNFKITYWSYKPIILEKIVKQNKIINYENRTITSIFLGTIENETQLYFRQKFKDWAEHIEEYYVADKLNLKQNAKYTFEEYIRKISKAKFGICFRGNGPKNYREIEYMSQGTPLIITDGIEINYPEPLIEGLHYFYAKSPADINTYIKNMTESKWNEMSKACREWYERNATSKSLFEYLEKNIINLNLSKEKPKTVFIQGNIKGYDYFITSESFKIYNLNTSIVVNQSENSSGIILEAGEIIVNELPYIGSDIDYVYKIKKNDYEYIRNVILNSNIIAHKKLATLLKHRLSNYKIRLFDENLEEIFPISPYINKNDQLEINDNNNISYEISIDYDYCRNLFSNYIHKKIIGKGNILFPEITIREAYLYCVSLNDDQEIVINFRSHVLEFVAKFEDIPNENIAWREFKLWEWEAENLSLKSLNIIYVENKVQKEKILYNFPRN